MLADPTRLRQISERIPAGRWGEPRDFAGPVVFLASQASQYVCGELLVVDGVRLSFSSFPSLSFALSFLYFVVVVSSRDAGWLVMRPCRTKTCLRDRVDPVTWRTRRTTYEVLAALTY